MFETMARNSSDDEPDDVKAPNPALRRFATAEQKQKPSPLAPDHPCSGPHPTD